MNPISYLFSPDFSLLSKNVKIISSGSKPVSSKKYQFSQSWLLLWDVNEKTTCERVVLLSQNPGRDEWVKRSMDLNRPSLGEGVSGNYRAMWPMKGSRGKFRVSWVHACPERVDLDTQAVTELEVCSNRQQNRRNREVNKEMCIGWNRFCRQSCSGCNPSYNKSCKMQN